MFRCVFLVVSLVLCVVADEHAYVVRINENGHVFDQRVTDAGDLLIIEVPAHANRQHAIFYLDYANNQELVKYVDLNKCQLSVIDENVRHQRMYAPQIERSSTDIIAHNAAMGERTQIIRLEQEQPLSNASRFLRTELLQACAGLPIYKVDKILEKELSSLVSEKKLKVEDGDSGDFLMVPFDSDAAQKVTSCNVRDPNAPPFDGIWYMCRMMCQYQKCKMATLNNACYYFITCPLYPTDLVRPECFRHQLSGSYACQNCCIDIDAPRCPLMHTRHCDCIKN